MKDLKQKAVDIVYIKSNSHILEMLKEVTTKKGSARSYEAEAAFNSSIVLLRNIIGYYDRMTEQEQQIVNNYLNEE